MGLISFVLFVLGVLGLAIFAKVKALPSHSPLLGLYYVAVFMVFSGSIILGWQAATAKMKSHWGFLQKLYAGLGTLSLIASIAILIILLLRKCWWEASLVGTH